ncbi:MAG: DUF4097 family beta strand repeat protein, partial [Clostridia bacterium]|nr:DUF4097 family beta strand repeat protein [Clostridia bacterium]
MKKIEKIWWTVGIALVSLGLILFIIVMSVNAWNFSALSTTKMQTREYTLTQDFNAISIDVETADVTFVKTDDGTKKVVCYEEENRAHAVSVQDGALNVSVTDTRKWYEYIGISWHNPSITVYLPETEYGVLQLKSSTGDIEIPQNFRFDSLDVTLSTGDITVSASVVNNAKIKTTTGDVCVERTSVGALDISVTTGDVEIDQVSASGAVKVNVTTGDATLSAVTCQSLVSDGSTGSISLEDVIATQSFYI